MREIQADDVLVVVRLDRLARSVSHLLETIERLEARACSLKITSQLAAVSSSVCASVAGRRSRPWRSREAGQLGHGTLLFQMIHALPRLPRPFLAQIRAESPFVQYRKIWTTGPIKVSGERSHIRLCRTENQVITW